jgi:2-phosphosulfolactate phosphatase
MPPIVNVNLLPTLTTPEQLAGKTVVVIDVLRATTTIVHALAAGAKEVVPCLEVEEARRWAEKHSGHVVLGGERGGLRIDGFQLGNSPAEYTAASVGGKTVVFTTTNGTKAMLQCRQAARVLIGAFVNFSAVCRELAGADAVELLCAGTENHITREDVLLAGAIADELRRGASSQLQLNDQAEIAADAWRAAAGDLAAGKLLAAAIGNSRGGRNLIEIGQERDIDIAAQIDKFDIVPELDLAAWTIRAEH